MPAAVSLRGVRTRRKVSTSCLSDGGTTDCTLGRAKGLDGPVDDFISDIAWQQRPAVLHDEELSRRMCFASSR